MDSVAAKVKADILECVKKAQAQAYTKLFANLRQMVNAPTVSDVVFLCNDGNRVQACRLLLAGRSDVFKNMLMNGMAESNLSEIPLREISSPVLLSVFEFLYTGTVSDYQPQSWRMACEIVTASRFFILPELDMITRKFMHAQTSLVAKDLPKVASFLTEDVEFEALCDEEDVTLRNLVIILSSNWSEKTFVRNLSKDAFYYLLANSKISCSEDDDKLSFEEYLRFTQVIRWWVYESNLESCLAEDLVTFLAPDEEIASTICAYPDETDLYPLVEGGEFSNEYSSFQLPRDSVIRLLKYIDCRFEGGEFSNEYSSFQLPRDSVIRLLKYIDCRLIHPVLLTKVVERLNLVSSEDILSAFRYHALRRPVSAFRYHPLQLPKIFKRRKNAVIRFSS